MNTVSETAYYCCGVRMEDAARPDSICNDRYAQRFMDARALEAYAPFRSLTLPNISNAARCRIIDDLLRDAITRDTAIISIGAGFDTRPYRLQGGTWFELDEPPLLARKEELLPARECGNPLRRIPIEFARESLEDKLAGAVAAPRVIVVFEGVFMYLEPQAIESNLRALRRLYPAHTLLCDLMNRRHFEKFSGKIHARLAAMGGRFAPRPDRPEALFLEQGYTQAARTSMVQKALELGVYRRRLRFPDRLARLLLGTVLKDLHGYAVHDFRVA